MIPVRSGYGLVFLAAVLWGLIGLISHGVLTRGVSSLEIAFWRALLGGGMFAIHAGAAGQWRLRQASDFAALSGFALVGVSLFYASLILAIDTGGTSLAFILLYSAPLFVTAAAWLLLGEPITRRKLLLVPLATCGLVLVAISGGTGVTVNATSLSWGLLSGLSYSAYYIFGKFILHRYRPVTIFAWALPLGALALLPLVEFTAKDAGAWLLMFVLAALSTYLAYLLYYRGLARVEASRAVLVATIEPVVALTLAAIFLGERIGPLGVVGASLVLLAAVLISLGSANGRSGSRMPVPTVGEEPGTGGAEPRSSSLDPPPTP